MRRVRWHPPASLVNEPHLATHLGIAPSLVELVPAGTSRRSAQHALYEPAGVFLPESRRPDEGSRYFPQLDQFVLGQRS